MSTAGGAAVDELRGVGRLFADDIPFTAAQRLARRAVCVLNPFFQIKSLRDFNAKFDPDWLPRGLVFRRPADLARVGLLYAGAEGSWRSPASGSCWCRSRSAVSRRRPRPEHR